jgi:hypothetical protein
VIADGVVGLELHGERIPSVEGSRVGLYRRAAATCRIADAHDMVDAGARERVVLSIPG